MTRFSEEQITAVLREQEGGACTIFSVDRTSMRFAHRRADDGALRWRSLGHAHSVLRLWRDDYNHVRPHIDVGGLTPADAASRITSGDELK